MLTFKCDYNMRCGQQARRIFRVISNSESAALRRVRERLDTTGILPVEITRVPGSIPLEDMLTENFTVEYLIEEGRAQ